MASSKANGYGVQHDQYKRVHPHTSYIETCKLLPARSLFTPSFHDVSRNNQLR